jgi:hypothetical protein
VSTQNLVKGPAEVDFQAFAAGDFQAAVVKLRQLSKVACKSVI